MGARRASAQHQCFIVVVRLQRAVLRGVGMILYGGKEIGDVIRQSELAVKDDELKKIAAKIIGRHSFQLVKNPDNKAAKKLDHTT
uniref:Uncharacterized protein n=1 Tax=Romanomermis culicivorax TaxID=13658 RepID=A0A915L4Y1_ROMCU